MIVVGIIAIAIVYYTLLKKRDRERRNFYNNFNLPEEDSHSDWDGTFTAPTSGTFQATIPNGAKIAFKDGIFTAPETGTYTFGTDEEGNMIGIKLED